MKYQKHFLLCLTAIAVTASAQVQTMPEIRTTPYAPPDRTNPDGSVTPDTVLVAATFYDFHSDRSNPEFEQPHGGGLRTGMVGQYLDRDGKPVMGANPYMNHGIRFWFRDWGDLGSYLMKDSITPAGRGYLEKFRPVYMYGSGTGQYPPPRIRESANSSSMMISEWSAVVNTGVSAVPYAYGTATRRDTTLTFDLESRTYSIDTAFTNRVVKSHLVFQRTAAGAYQFQGPAAANSSIGGYGGAFFPLNNYGFNVGGSTVNNWRSSGTATSNNYAYTMEAGWDFVYSKDDTLNVTFNGDDDMWLFVNGRLALDVGGIHDVADGTVSLNTIAASHGLVDGGIYTINMFYCERHSDDANINLVTNTLNTNVVDTDVSYDAIQIGVMSGGEFSVLGSSLTPAAADTIDMYVGDDTTLFVRARREADGVWVTAPATWTPAGLGTLTAIPNQRAHYTYTADALATGTGGVGLILVTLPNNPTVYAYVNIRATERVMPPAVVSAEYVFAGGTISQLRVTLDKAAEAGWFVGAEIVLGGTPIEVADIACLSLDVLDAKILVLDYICAFGAIIPESLASTAGAVIHFDPSLEWQPLTITAGGVAVLDRERVVPNVKPDVSAVVVIPTNSVGFELTVGPNPVNRQGGVVNIFVTGGWVDKGELTIYDAAGNVINKIRVYDDAVATGNVINKIRVYDDAVQSRRIIGSWDMKDRKGRPVSDGTYLLRGVVKTINGKREKVSIVIGVR